LSGLPRGFTAPVPLGHGAEGRTVLCWQKEPGRWVVLKIATSAGAARFRHEAQILGLLAGGPVPALLGQDLSGRHPWLAMTWIDGIPLDDIPAAIGVPERRAIVLQASLAAARLHGARMVHGDLSAANLIARPHGEVGVVDFGLSPPPGSSEVPSIEGAWEILPPERLQGGPPDPRWDVFALGVIGSRLLGAIPAACSSRDEWTEFVGSGEAAKSARGRSWGLSLALDPDPTVRPADAAALVRVLEREWGDPPLSREIFVLENAKRLERFLAAGVRLAASRGDWDSAWRIQRERIERATDPVALLSELGEFQRKRRNPPGRTKWWALAAIGVLLVGATVWKYSGARDDIPAELDPVTTFSDETFVEEADREPGVNDVLVFDPPPPGSILKVDGKASEPPPHGFLRLDPGLRHVVLLDSTGEEIFDTTIDVPGKAKVFRRRSVVTTGKQTNSVTPPRGSDSATKKRTQVHP